MTPPLVVPDPGATYRDAAGAVRPRARRVTLQPETALHCPHRHALRAPVHALRESIQPCRAWDRQGQACSALLYVVRDFTHRDGQTFALVAPITADEVHRLRHLTEAARLRYLGVTLEAIG